MRKYLITSALILLSQSGMAQNVTANMQASVNLAPACAISIDNVDLGVTAYNYDKVSLGTMKTICSKGITGVIFLSAGNSANVRERYMVSDSNPGEKLKYDVIKPGKNDIIGDGTNATVTIPVQGTGDMTTQFLSFMVLRGQYVKAGSYYDNLTLTLNY